MFQRPGSNRFGARPSRAGLLTSLMAAKLDELNHQPDNRNDKHRNAEH